MTKHKIVNTPEFVLKSRARVLSKEETIREVYSHAKINPNQYPINMWEIAKSLDFDVFEANFKDETVTGMMFDYEEETQVTQEISSKRAVVLNKADELKIKSFTLAHEIAHFLLHVNKNDRYFERYHLTMEPNQENLSSEAQYIKYQEDAADGLAAKLLMPPDTFLQLVEQSVYRHKKDKLAEELSDAFMVGTKAIHRRFDELNVAF